MCSPPIKSSASPLLLICSKMFIHFLGTCWWNILKLLTFPFQWELPPPPPIAVEPLLPPPGFCAPANFCNFFLQKWHIEKVFLSLPGYNFVSESELSIRCWSASLSSSKLAQILSWTKYPVWSRAASILLSGVKYLTSIWSDSLSLSNITPIFTQISVSLFRTHQFQFAFKIIQPPLESQHRRHFSEIWRKYILNGNKRIRESESNVKSQSDNKTLKNRPPACNKCF